MSKLFTDLVMEAAQVLRQKDGERFAEVIRWMLSADKAERKQTRKGKRVVLLAHVQGKSGKFFIDASMLNQGEPNE